MERRHIEIERAGRPYWDRRRKVHYPLLATQFALCLGCWVVVVLALGGQISRPGLLASAVTAWILASVSWVLAKMGLPQTQDQRPARTPAPPPVSDRTRSWPVER